MIASPLKFSRRRFRQNAIQELFVIGAKEIDVDKGIFLLEKLNQAIGVGEVRRKVD